MMSFRRDRGPLARLSGSCFCRRLARSLFMNRLTMRRGAMRRCPMCGRATCFRARFGFERACDGAQHHTHGDECENCAIFPQRETLRLGQEH